MKYLFSLLFFLMFQSVNAQYDTIYMAVLPFQSNYDKDPEYVKAVQTHVTQTLDKDYRFILVDRDEFDAVAREREYQKSEDFIDGEIVEQGKAVGAQYLFEGYYDYPAKLWTFRVFEVSNGALKYSIVANKARTEGESGLTKLLYAAGQTESSTKAVNPFTTEKPQRPSSYIVTTNIKHLIKECFPQKPWPVLRPTEETTKKVKEVLIAAGSRMGLKKGTIIEVLVEVEEDFDGIKRSRIEPAGWGRVIKVESENFSILKIESGSKNIRKLFDQNNKLRCRYVKK